MQRPKNPLLPILIFVTAYASPALVTAVDNPPTSNTGATDTARAPSASKPPMVTKNPDGTITLRKILLRNFFPRPFESATYAAGFSSIGTN
jgi:hypothetical protein